MARVVVDGFIVKVYDDGFGIPTVGLGHKVLPQDHLHLGDVIPVQRARNFVTENLRPIESAINRDVRAPFFQHEYDALVTYERTIALLNKKVDEIVRLTRATDLEHHANGEPEALPFFEKAQANWKIYRDNACYADVYQVDQSSLRFVDFWDCMTQITRNRLQELTNPHSHD